MKSMCFLTRALVAFCLVIAFSCARGEEGLVALPALTARVTDLTGTLDAGQKGALESKLAAFEKEKGSQVAILLVPTTRPETIEQYAIRLAEAWKVGRKGTDDGVILLVAKNDRRMRLEVGYGLEGALTDLVCKRIVAEVMAPRFKAGDWAGGLDAGIEAVLATIRGESLPPPKAPSGGGAKDERTDYSFGLLMVFLSTWVVVKALGRLLGGLALGAATAAILVFAYGSLLIATIAGAAIFLFIQMVPAGFLAVRGGGPGIGGSSGSSSGGWSSGSSDSWSGGGGDFGGGGASGDW